jgi:hypothetical protein
MTHSPFASLNGAILSAPYDPEATLIMGSRGQRDSPLGMARTAKPYTNAALANTTDKLKSEAKLSTPLVKRMLRGAIVGVLPGIVIESIYAVAFRAPHSRPHYGDPPFIEYVYFPINWIDVLLVGAFLGLILGALINSFGRLLISKIWKD